MEMSIRFPNLGLEFDYVPKSFQIFGFEITIYGILIAVGMILGISFVVLEAKRSNQDQDKYLDMIILSLAAAVVGARLSYVGFNWTLYKGNPMEIFNLRGGGVWFYGGLLGGVLAAALFCRASHLSFWQMADTSALGLLIGQAVGRWGNLFNRESFGEYTDGILAMQLPISAVRSGEVTQLMRENLISEGGVSFIQVSPVFLYESLWCLLLFLILLAVKRKKKFHGEVFMLYLAGYGLGRFCFEWLRTDSLMIPGTKIPAGLVISAALVLFFAPVVWVKRTMSRKRAAARKRRREKIYQAQEEASRIEDEKEAARQAEREALLKEKEEDSSREESEESLSKEKDADTGEPDMDSDNWENSRYAHIADTWRHISPKEKAVEETGEENSEMNAEEIAEEAASVKDIDPDAELNKENVPVFSEETEEQQKE